jgi:hypothetical protein
MKVQWRLEHLWIWKRHKPVCRKAEMKLGSSHENSLASKVGSTRIGPMWSSCLNLSLDFPIVVLLNPQDNEYASYWQYHHNVSPILRRLFLTFLLGIFTSTHRCSFIALALFAESPSSQITFWMTPIYQSTFLVLLHSIQHIKINTNHVFQGRRIERPFEPIQSAEDVWESCYKKHQRYASLVITLQAPTNKS